MYLTAAIFFLCGLAIMVGVGFLLERDDVNLDYPETVPTAFAVWAAIGVGLVLVGCVLVMLAVVLTMLGESP